MKEYIKQNRKVLINKKIKSPILNMKENLM